MQSYDISKHCSRSLFHLLDLYLIRLNDRNYYLCDLFHGIMIINTYIYHNFVGGMDINLQNCLHQRHHDYEISRANFSFGGLNFHFNHYRILSGPTHRTVRRSLRGLGPVS